MAVIPTGDPCWACTSSIETYGGNVDKKNYLDIGIVDPKTDVDAGQFSRMVEDVQMMNKTADFAVITFTCNDTATEDPTLNAYWGMHGNGEGAAPTMTRLGDGYVSIEWESSYSDSYGITLDVNLTQWTGNVHGITPAVVNAEFSTITTLLLQVSDMAGDPELDRTVTIRVRR